MIRGRSPLHLSRELFTARPAAASSVPKLSAPRAPYPEPWLRAWRTIFATDRVRLHLLVRRHAHAHSPCRVRRVSSDITASLCVASPARLRLSRHRRRPPSERRAASESSCRPRRRAPGFFPSSAGCLASSRSRLLLDEPFASSWLKGNRKRWHAGTPNSVLTSDAKTDRAQSICRDFPPRAQLALLRSASLRFSPLRSALLRSAPNREQSPLLVAPKVMRARRSRPVLSRRSAPLVAPYPRSAFFSISTSAATCPSTRGQLPDRRPSVSLPLLAPPRVRRSRRASFSFCGRSPSGAPVSPVLAAPLSVSGYAQAHANHSPGSF